MFEGMILIGENLNATRKIKADGKLVVDLGGGRKGYGYKTANGEQKYLDLTEALKAEAVVSSGKVGHIATGIVNRDEEFIASMAQSQVKMGADILDCCVDEISPWQEERIKHMRWLVKTVQKYVRVPVSVDSSDPAVLRAGLEEIDWSLGKPMINSVNLEEARLPILEIAAETKALLLGNGSGRTSLPNNIEERVANLSELMGLMDKAGIAMEDRTLDPLVLPVGTNPEYGNHFLEACRQLRAAFGPAFHMTGGFSNVSFGLPNRRLINEAFTWLAKEAGCDTAFIDPAQVRSFKPEDEGFKLAIAALTGQDPYCMNYIMFCRAQEASA